MCVKRDLHLVEGNARIILGQKMHQTCHPCTLLTLFEDCTEAALPIKSTNAFNRLNGDLAQNYVSTQIASKSFLYGLQHKFKFRDFSKFAQSAEGNRTNKGKNFYPINVEPSLLE